MANEPKTLGTFTPNSGGEPAAVRRALVELSNMVADLAYRCHEALGTDESQRIQQRASDIAAFFHNIDLGVLDV